MHNPTRRMKRSTTGPSNGLTGTLSNSSVDENLVNDSFHVRRQAHPDALRGSMLIALVTVTVILYLILWELERSSFTSISKPLWSQRALPSHTRQTYPSLKTPKQGQLTRESDFIDDRIAASSSQSMARIQEGHDIPVLAEEHTGDRSRDEVSDSSLFDAKNCNGACRFLLPVRIGEQESKARVHLMQLLMLAQRLNRTIVLPDVGNSRMSACSEWPFDAYYDTNPLAHGSDVLEFRPAIDLMRFAEWVRERPEPPNSFLVSLKHLHQDHHGPLGARGDPEDVPFITHKAETDPKIVSCLESKLARLQSFLPEVSLSVSFDPRPIKRDLEHASTRLMQLLSNSLDLDANTDHDLVMEPPYEYTHKVQYANSSYLSLADVDVLMLDYDLRHALFPTSADGHVILHYAPVLYDLADRLSDNLGPFLGIHWRMEHVPVQNLAWCAASLVSTLHALLLDDITGERVRYVWLATDYPRPLGSSLDAVRVPVGNGLASNGIASAGGLDADAGSPLRYGPLRKSGTFNTLSFEHDDAIGIFTEAFRPGGDLEGWKLTDLAEQLHRYPYVEGRFEVNETLLSDSGVFGILDKLVIVQARHFVSGSADCGKTSSFSKQIIEARRETFETKRGKGPGTIRNVVEYFGSW